jgi:hypothetical protein
MKKFLLIIILIVIATAIINLCSNDKPSAKKEYKITLADGTICEWFEVGPEYESISTTRILKPEEYQMVADSFHFPKEKMIYFHMNTYRLTGEQYGTLYSKMAIPVANFNPDSLTIKRNAKRH